MKSSLLICLSLLFSSQCKADEYNVQDNSIYFEAVRFQVLSPTLVRIQQPANGEFKDTTDLGVVNLKFPATVFHVEKKDGRYRIETDAMVLEYAPGVDFQNGGITAQRKEGTVKVSRLAEPDTQNLGGVISGLDNTMGNERFAKQNDVGSKSREVSIPDGLLSKRGWTVLKHTRDRLTLLKENEKADDLYLFVYGTNYAAAFRDFHQLAGPIPMLPKWAFGLFYSRWKDYSAEDYKGLVDGFRSRKMPLDVVIADMNWHRDGWFGYAYDTKNFPDIAAFHQWTDSVHLKTGFNHHSGAVAASDPRTREFCQRAGIDYETSQVPDPFDPKNKIVKYDPSNPVHFKAFYDIFVAQLLKDGVDFHWVDGDKTIYSSDNYYQFTKDFTKLRPIVLNRLNDDAMANHRYPLGFSGDVYIAWESLAFTMEVTLKGGNNGVYWSHDIGGYLPQGSAGYEPNAELFARWMQFGAVSPVFRLHAKNPLYWTPKLKPGDFDPGSRLPWEWGDEVLQSAQQSIQLRYRLIPYLYGLSKAAHDTGVPVVGAMYHHYPSDENAYNRPDQFMVGPQILAAPFTKPSGTGVKGQAERKVWLPEGDWVDYFSRKVVQGGREITVAKSISEFPLFVKAGAILPAVPYVEYAMQPVDRQIFEIYQPTSDHSATYSLYEDDGVGYGYEKGEFRTTEVTYTYRKGAGYDIQIKKPVGAYATGLSERSYSLVIVQSAKPKQVLVNDHQLAQSTSGWQFKNNTLSINVDKHYNQEDIKVMVSY